MEVEVVEDVEGLEGAHFGRGRIDTIRNGLLMAREDRAEKGSVAVSAVDEAK